jgi:hypothetical protein
MNTINNKLANKEFKIYEKINESGADFESINNEYLSIIKDYINLADREMEATKRATFLLWYSISEPSQLTGLPELAKKDENKLMSILLKRLENNLIDDELLWMIKYYFDWEYIFSRFPQYEKIIKILDSKVAQLPDNIDKERMSIRGLMGIYWNSIINNKASS